MISWLWLIPAAVLGGAVWHFIKVLLHTVNPGGGCDD
jgi:hypothetical protein